MSVGDLGAVAGGAAAILLALAAVLGLSRRTATPAAVSAAIGCAALVVLGLAVIFGPAVSWQLGDVLGFVPVDVHYDPLAGTFLLGLGSVGMAASIYAIGYEGASRSRLDGLAYPVFLGSMALVFGAANIFAFLLAWELMALASGALVVGPRPGRQEARAGYIYLAMTHLATAAIVVAFAILAAAGGTLQTAQLTETAAALPDLLRDAVFLLLLVGFGTKAGMVPLHVWLPRAHPVAPSHVSALMSGVMIKAGVYGLIRFGLDVLGPGPSWWGLLILALGAVSALLGVLYALSEHDLKRLLAFHSIENIGIILMGLGIAFLGSTMGSSALFSLGLAAALFHSLNHGLFKGALFLAAGAVQVATGSRDMNDLGGLARGLPFTALAFGVGAVAISGLPPLNGFASEWMTFQSLLSLGIDGAAEPVVRSAAFVAVGALAMTAALALACFVKATGMTFLALPRSPSARRAREVPGSLRVAMGILALGCIATGLLAGPMNSWLTGVAGTVPETQSGPIAATAPATLGDYAPILLTLLLAALAVAGVALLRLRAERVRRVPTWTCGIMPDPAFEYTATSFAKPIQLFFEPVYRTEREIRVELVPGTPFRNRVHYRSEVDHLTESWLYRPLHRFGVVFAHAARRLQQGTLQLYVAYIVAAVIVLLLVAR